MKIATLMSAAIAAVALADTTTRTGANTPIPASLATDTSSQQLTIDNFHTKWFWTRPKEGK